jgi:hypothetical protein
MYFVLFSYSHLATDIKNILSNEKYTCVLDYNERGESSESIYRVYIIDTQSGEKIDRKYIGKDAELIDLRINTLIYRNKETFYFMDLNSRKITKKISKKQLVEKYEELKIGIDEIKYEKELNNYIYIKAKDAKIYYLNFYNDILLKEYKPNDIFPKYLIKELYIAEVDENNINNTICSFNSTTTSELKFVNNYINNSTSDTLLLPFFLNYHNKKQTFIVVSYKTLDETEFILTAYNKNFKINWRLEQNQIFNKTFFTRSNNINKSFIVNNDLIFNIGNLLYSINIDTGKVNWKTLL